MRILLVAPGSKPEALGETRIAYEWLEHLAKRHEVTALSSYMRSDRPLAGRIPGARIIEWKDPPLVGRFERFNAMLNPAYVPFYWKARRWIRAALARGERFDVGHQVAPISMRYPSPLSGSGLPYVIGPVGGSLKSPDDFVQEENGAPWFTDLRRLDDLRLRHDPLLRRSFEQAGCVLGIGDYVGELLSDLDVRAIQVMSDVGVEVMPEPTAPSLRTTGVRFLYVGRVIRTKGVRDALRALHYVQPGRATLDIVGDGYDRTVCEALSVELGLADVVRFHGRLPHDEVLHFFPKADVFLFPSYREAGGIVVTEAMSFGLPVIACDYGGPTAMVDASSGIRVPAHSRDQYARALATAMERLAENPQLRADMGRSARERVRDLALWDRRIDTVEDLYENLCGTRPASPWP